MSIVILETSREDTLNPEIQQKLSPDLRPGEHLLWAGRPRTGIAFRTADLFLIPFSLLWAGFAVFWEWSAWKLGGKEPFLIFGGFFVLVGLYISIGRFFVDALIRGCTFYGLTNERIIILRRRFGRNARSLPLRSLVEINISTKSDGSGTITFGSFGSLGMVSGWGNVRFGIAGQQVLPSFEFIEDAKSVHTRILEAQGQC